MARTSLHDTYENTRDSTVAAARQVSNGVGQAALQARTTGSGIASFRAAIREQPLVMAVVLLSVGYFVRTVLYPAPRKR